MQIGNLTGSSFSYMTWKDGEMMMAFLRTGKTAGGSTESPFYLVGVGLRQATTRNL